MNLQFHRRDLVLPSLFALLGVLLVSGCGGSAPSTQIGTEQSSAPQGQATLTAQILPEQSTPTPDAQSPATGQSETIEASQPTATAALEDILIPTSEGDYEVRLNVAADLIPHSLKPSLEKALSTDLTILDTEREYDPYRDSLRLTIAYQLPDGVSLPPPTNAPALLADAVIEHGATVDLQPGTTVLDFKEMGIEGAGGVKARGRIIPQDSGVTQDAQGKFYDLPDRVQVILLFEIPSEN